VTVNALLCQQLNVVKAGMFSLKPLFALGGLTANNLEYFAGRTGGESLKVHNADDYGRGLETILGHLASRYSLGFTLSEKDRDDGRFHALKVRLTVRDKSGKKLPVKVLAPAGYYMAVYGSSN